MTEIAPERKISIAFIKVFRKNLDDTIKKTFAHSQFAPEQAKISVQFLFGKLGKIPDGLEDKLAAIFRDINVDFMNFMNEMYEEMLPQCICNSMDSIEEYFRSNFSKEELNELAALTENPTVVKMLQCAVFNVLTEQRLSFRDKVNDSLYEYTGRTDVKDRIQNAVQEFMDKPYLDETYGDDEN